MEIKNYRITLKSHTCILLACLTAAGCTDPAPRKAVVRDTTVQNTVMAPFRYHKTIEVSPGLFYDVLSWGRGAFNVGAFQILRSDSAAMKYTTTTGDLEGRIVDVYNADMDTDGNPEIFVQTQLADSTNASKIYAFEYNQAAARQLDFPKLTRSQRQGYQGNDNFFIKDGKLMREFALFGRSDSSAKPTGQKRLLQYDLRGNELSARQISRDSTDTDSPTPDVDAAQPRVAIVSHRAGSRTAKHSSSKKKKSSPKKEVKKKRRRHRG